MQVVVNRQQIAGQPGAAIAFGVAAFLVGTLARVFGIGKRTHEAVAHLIAFGGQALKRLIRIGQRIHEILGQRGIVGRQPIGVLFAHPFHPFTPDSTRPTNWAV